MAVVFRTTELKQQFNMIDPQEKVELSGFVRETRKKCRERGKLCNLPCYQMFGPELEIDICHESNRRNIYYIHSCYLFFCCDLLKIVCCVEFLEPGKTLLPLMAYW